MIARPISMRYEVLERVGESPLFQVFKTRDRVLGRVVAVKMVQPALASDEGFVSALESSARALEGLSHPGIARIYETGRDGGTPFLVTEFARGINLKERIRRIAPFTLSVAVDFAIAMGEALHHAHAQGIVHGDLRPQNLIISPEGAVKLTDFGLTAALEASPRAAAACLDRMAPYEAPELGLGQPPSIESDLYAVGVILYEMLTGMTPFAGDSAVVIARRHQTEPPPSPRERNAGIPRPVEGILLKALEKRPQDRYRTAADLLSDLKSVRDALRFGRSLSWSPLGPATPEVDSAATRTAAAPLPAQPAGPAPMYAPGGQAPQASRKEARMPAAAVEDDRISPYLKVAIATVVVIIITSAIAGIAVWMATFAKPPDQRLPNLVGMDIAAVRAIAEKANIRLMEHEEFNEKFDAGKVYRTDWPPGRPVRPGRCINVWVSRGSRMVWVPDLVNRPGEEAERILREKGLTLGAVDRQYHDKILFGCIIAQNPKAGKRVNRDVPVNLIISDGPKPAPDEPAPDEYAAPEITPPDGGGQPLDTGSEDTEPRSFKLSIVVNPDGRGPRRVRVEYDDARGTHTPIDEMHDEGDRIVQRVEVVGSEITVRVYYGDDPLPAREQRMAVPRSR